MRPHAPGQQAGSHLAPAHTEGHNPPGCGRNGMHDAPRYLSPHRGIGADQVESTCPRQPGGGGGGVLAEAVEGEPWFAGWRKEGGRRPMVREGYGVG